MDGTVWTVERGAYSDHRVMCACETKAQAAGLVAAYNAEEDTYQTAFVGELPVVAEVERITTYGMQLDIWDDGTVSRPYQRERATTPLETTRTELSFDMLHPYRAKPVTWRWVRAPVHRGKGGRLEVFGTDLERVRRVYSDRRAQLLAEDAFRQRREVKG
jgi:hypothetical protein